MLYKTLRKLRLFRNGRWIYVDKDYILSEQEVKEAPNIKAWIRWGYLKEVTESKKKKAKAIEAKNMDKTVKVSRTPKKKEK